MFLKGICFAVASFCIVTSQERQSENFTSEVLPVSDIYSNKSYASSLLNGEIVPLNPHERVSDAKSPRSHHQRLNNHSHRNNHHRKQKVHLRKIRREQKPRTGILPWDTTENRYYGKWGKWSSCSKSCVTERYRRCRYPNVCGRYFQRDIAYCYTDGSSCAGWVRKQILQMKKDETKGIVENKWETTETRLSRAWNGTKTFQCGVSENVKEVVPTLKIVGGRPTERGRWPWQVAILNRMKEVYCGGTLIAPKWVLTAAHCTRGKMFVRAGEYDLSVDEDTEIDVKVSKVVVHPKYNQETVDADIALLMMPYSILFETLTSYGIMEPGIACLPRHRQQLPVKQMCVTTGWGKSNFNHLHGTDILHEVQVPILSTEVCQKVHRHYLITDNMFCAGNKRRPADSCSGDSGGPLLCKDRQGHWTVFGITSFGDGCGTRGKFGIYVKVPKFTKWIHSVMSKFRQTGTRHTFTQMGVNMTNI